MNFINMERVSLKNNPNIKEDMIQKYIYENPMRWYYKVKEKQYDH